MKRLTAPRDDNPRNEMDYLTRHIRLICTDCSPQAIVTDRDVSYWDEMPPQMVEKDGDRLAFEDMATWMEHMRTEHGIWQPMPQLDGEPQP